jgi:hypothetical protein
LEILKLIGIIEKRTSVSSKKKIVDKSIVGIWKDKFPKNKSTIKIAKDLRKEVWK